MPKSAVMIWLMRSKKNVENPICVLLRFEFFDSLARAKENLLCYAYEPQSLAAACDILESLEHQPSLGKVFAINLLKIGQTLRSRKAIHRFEKSVQKLLHILLYASKPAPGSSIPQTSLS